MMESFSYVCRMFSFGSSQCFEHFAAATHEPNHNFSEFLEDSEEELPELEPIFGDDCNFLGKDVSFLGDSSEDEGHFVFHECLEEHFEDFFFDCLDPFDCEEILPSDQGGFEHFLKGSAVENLRMFMCFPQVEDLTGDAEDCVMNPSDVELPAEASSSQPPREVKAPYNPGTPEGVEGSDYEIEVPPLEKQSLFDHECRGHWPYDRGCDACVQGRGRTPARRIKRDGKQGSSQCDLAADYMFVAGRHWRVLVMLMIQTGVIGAVVMTGQRDQDVRSTVAVLSEMGVGGQAVELITDNEPSIMNHMRTSLQKSDCRSFHPRNISEYRPQAKGMERAIGILKEGLFTNWLALEDHVGARLALESPLFGFLVGYTYRTHNAFCTKLKGGTPLEAMRERRGGQVPRSYPFGIIGFAKPVHAADWPGQKMVLCIYVGMRYMTGGGCLV